MKRRIRWVVHDRELEVEAMVHWADSTWLDISRSLWYVSLRRTSSWFKGTALRSLKRRRRRFWMVRN